MHASVQSSSAISKPAQPASSLLSKVLWWDAVSSLMSGLLMVFGAQALEPLLGLPTTLLRTAGLVLLPFAGFAYYLSRRTSPLRPAVWTVVACNLLWAVDCVILAFSNWVSPSALGVGFLLAQALVVAVFAELQIIGLKRSRNPIGEPGTRWNAYPPNR